MKSNISAKKQSCLTHASAIKQTLRKGYQPGDQDGIQYRLWCTECDHHLTFITHDQAWRLKCQGVPFLNLKYQITNSTYKNMVRLDVEKKTAEIYGIKIKDSDWR